MFKSKSQEAFFFSGILFQVTFVVKEEEVPYPYEHRTHTANKPLYKFCPYFLSRPQIYQVPSLTRSYLNGRTILLSAFLQDWVS